MNLKLLRAAVCATLVASLSACGGGGGSSGSSAPGVEPRQLAPRKPPRWP